MPRKGNVKRSIATPKPIGIAAARPWLGVPLTFRLDRRDHEHGRFPRRDGRARGGDLRDRRLDVRRDHPLAAATRRPRSSRRSWPERASGSCATTSIRPGSSWATRGAPPRLHPRDPVRGGAPENGGHRCPVLPAARARDPDRRHVVRPRQAAEARASSLRGDRTHLHHRFANIGFSQRRAAVYMYGWCAVLAGAALATRFIPFRAHGIWHLWPTVAVATIGLAALATSIYIVYLLEIVKLANPRIKRREQQSASGRPPEMSELLQAVPGDQARIEELLAADPDLERVRGGRGRPSRPVRELLDEDPSLANAWAEDGFQPLGLASFFGHVGRPPARQRGAEVNSASRNDMKVMPLHSAAAADDPEVRYEIAKLLLEAGADPNARQQDDYTALMAAEQSETSLRSLLIERGAGEPRPSGATASVDEVRSRRLVEARRRVGSSDPRRGGRHARRRGAPRRRRRRRMPRGAHPRRRAGKRQPSGRRTESPPRRECARPARLAHQLRGRAAKDRAG